jgi:hypothetical protein
VPLPYKGFVIEIHEEPSPRRFRYEIRHGERSLITSFASYVSEAAAEHAARVFVDGVDRMIGLDPPGRKG